MTTYSNNCVGCGCGPAIPEPCITPPPVCLDPQPCTEIINAECVIYTGPAITCNFSPVIPANSSIAEALESIVEYLCFGRCCVIPLTPTIDLPDHIVLCTDETAVCTYEGKLYNWYALNAGTQGDGRVAGGIVNINVLDNPVNTWRVPNNNDWYSLILALDPTASVNSSTWANIAGGALKTEECWSRPNTGAIDSSGLSISAGVKRLHDTGLFTTNNGQEAWYWSAGITGNSSTTQFLLGYNFSMLSYFSASGSVYQRSGDRVRLVRPVDCNSSEKDGDFIPNAYTDNSGTQYNGQVIGTLVWLTTDLTDVTYNNGLSIPNIIFDAPWIAAIAGAWCYPNNDVDFTITYSTGCVERKITFRDFLQFLPTASSTFIVTAAAGIQVNSTVVGSQTTYTVTNTDPGSAQNIFKNIAVATQSTIVADTNNDTLTVVSGTGIAVTTNALTDELTITNSDLGSSQFIFKNIAVATQGTVVADSNNDTLTVVAGAGIVITTNPLTDEITITNTDPGGSGVTLADAGLDVVHESLVNVGTGPALAVKGLVAGAGIALSSTATDITITNTEVFPSFLEYNITDKTVWNNGQGNIGTNTSFGDLALRSNTIGNNSTAIGYSALSNSSTVSNSTAIGHNAMRYDTLGNSSVAIGAFANGGIPAINVLSNVAIGYEANFNGGNFSVVIGNQAAQQGLSNGVAIGTSVLQNMINPISTIAIGAYAMANGVGTTSLNTAIGWAALLNSTSGVSYNIAIGYEAMRSAVTSSQQNVSIGNGSLRNMTSGSFNTVIGDNALFNTTTGSSNTIIGQGAAYSNTIGSNNTVIGKSAVTGSFSGSVILGHSATATANNQFVVGSSSINAGAVTVEVLPSTKTWSVIINGVAQKILLA